MNDQKANEKKAHPTCVTTPSGCFRFVRRANHRLNHIPATKMAIAMKGSMTVVPAV
jgi:hypothetical protein